ncbi:hypothetical protein F7725_024514, partial [Dissostichus mawsoni]
MSSSTRNKAPNKQDISKEKNDKQRRPASPASASLKTDSNTCELDHEVTLLDELGKLRKENQEGHNQTKMSLDRLEQTVLDIKVQMGEHEGRIGKLEDRVGMAEDVAVSTLCAFSHREGWSHLSAPAPVGIRHSYCSFAVADWT